MPFVFADRLRNLARLTVMAAVVLTLPTLGPSVASAQTQQETNAGSAKKVFGVLDASSRKFRFACDFSANDAGVLTSLDEGGTEFKLDDVSLSPEKLEFAIKSTSAKYLGEYDAEKSAYVGVWKQRGAELPLSLKIVKQFPEEKLTAVWTGQISALFQKLDVQFRELENGEVYFDSLSQKVGGFVATKSVDGNQVTIEVPGVSGSFQGEINEEGNEINGKWKQGIAIDLVLTKSEVASLATETPEPNRPQMPKPPFPYSAQDIKFANASANIHLAGTLTIPNGDGPFPAVILVSGSGPQDRDESLAGHKPFWVLADHFSRNGIAVLRYDDRGVGDSEGDFAKATSEDFKSDADSAVAFLRKQASIDRAQIGICGHSEGGIIAPMVAAEDPELGFIILMAGPGVNGEHIVVSQAKLIMAAAGLPADEVEKQGQIQQALIDLAKKPGTEEEFVAGAKAIIEASLQDADKKDADIDATVEVAAQQLLSPWFKFFMAYDPKDAIRKVSCPTLALIGEKDLQVDPKLNLPEIEAALREAPTDNFKVLELPKLNHLFQECQTGLLEEYGTIEETINPHALELMSEWILSLQ